MCTERPSLILDRSVIEEYVQTAGRPHFFQRGSRIAGPRREMAEHAYLVMLPVHSTV